jgi:hypothetical protein
VAAVRRLAHATAGERGEPLADDWEARFTGLVEKASTEGWLTDEGVIRAHIEWNRP